MKAVLLLVAIFGVASVVGQINGAWSSYSTCTALCGGGTQTRTCTNPAPSDGGSDCTGISSRSCNTFTCRNCTLGYAYNGPCSNKCGAGTTWRYTYITQQPTPGGTPCPPNNVSGIACEPSCTARMSGKGYVYWGPLKGPGPIRYGVVRGNYEVDVFLFDQPNFFQYQYDAMRTTPYETGYTAVRSTLNVENSNEIVTLDTTSNYYLVVDNTLIGAAQGTNQNGQQVFTYNEFYFKIAGLEYGNYINTSPYSAASSSSPAFVTIMAAIIATVAALVR